MVFPYRAFFVLALIGLAPQLRADVTIRYELSEKLPNVPGLAPSHLLDEGHELTIRVRRDRGSISMGRFTTIVDTVRREATVVNLISKTFATLPLDGFLDRGLQFPAQYRATGRTETIHGIQAEEWRTGPLELWLPKAEQFSQAAALAELDGFRRPYNLSSVRPGPILFADPSGAMGVEQMVHELLQTKSWTLRFRASITRQELVELSMAPLDDAIFLPPRDCREAPFTEVLKLDLAPAPEVTGKRPGSLQFTLVDGVITYNGEDGSRKRIDVGKRCRYLWVAPDESAIAFIRVDKSDGYESDGEPFVRESTIFVARRSQNFVPVQVPIPTYKILDDLGVFVNPSISADGSTVFYMVPEGNYTFFFAYNLNTKQNQQVGGGIDYCTIWSGPDKGSILMYQRHWIGANIASALDPPYKFECFIASPGSRDIPGSCKEFESSFKSGAACTLPPR